MSNLKSLSCSLVVSSEQANQRIDTFFSANCPSFNRSIASLEETKFFINEKEVKKSKKVKAGDKVKVTWQDLIFENIEAQDIPLNILYEDNDILVINKEQNIVVHPASGNKDGTIVNALIHRYGSLFFALMNKSLFALALFIVSIKIPWYYGCRFKQRSAPKFIFTV